MKFVGANISSGIINFGSLLPNELFSLLVVVVVPTFPPKKYQQRVTFNDLVFTEHRSGPPGVKRDSNRSSKTRCKRK